MLLAKLGAVNVTWMGAVFGLLLLGMTACGRTVSAVSSASPITAGTSAAPFAAKRPSTEAVADPSAAEANLSLRRTVNFGNMLEGETEGSQGLKVEERYFDLARQVGFTAVRLPIRWSTHAQTTAPYTVDPAFFARVDEVLAWGRARNLTLILDFHNYKEMNADATHRERFLAIWKQIAERYREQPPQVLFELLNEPGGVLDSQWNDLQQQVLAVVRASNPTRNVIVTPARSGSIDHLYRLELPADSHLIVTVHNYTPMEFTHQGTTFTGRDYPTGVVWPQVGLRPANIWQDYSWFIEAKGVSGGVQVSQTQPYGAFRLHREQPAVQVKEVVFVVNRDVNMEVSCPPRHDPKVNRSVRINVRANEVTRVPAAQCGSDGTVGDVYLRPVGNEVQPSFVVSRWELNTAAGVQQLLDTAVQEATAPVRAAAAWGKANGRPIFLGEFGAHTRADNESRVRWAGAIRSEAERLNVSWGWWELASEFGLYDRFNNQWNEPLLRALIPVGTASH